MVDLVNGTAWRIEDGSGVSSQGSWVAGLGARTGTGAAMVVVSDGGWWIGLWYRLVQKLRLLAKDLAGRRRKGRAFVFPQDSSCA